MRGAGTVIQMKNILLPTDFSEYAQYAMRYARSFAREYGSVVHVVHVVEDSLYFTQFVYDGAPFDPSALLEGLAEDRRKRLEEFVAEIGPDVETRSYLRRGVAASEIVAAAKELNADLVVIATHGRTGLRHALFGSVAERVIRSAPCPCLVVRRPGEASEKTPA